MGLIDVFGDQHPATLNCLVARGVRMLLVLIEFFNLLYSLRDGSAAIIPIGLLLSSSQYHSFWLYSGWKGGELVLCGHVEKLADNEKIALDGQDVHGRRSRELNSEAGRVRVENPSKCTEVTSTTERYVHYATLGRAAV